MRDVMAEATAATRNRRVGEFVESLSTDGGLGMMVGGVLVSWRIRMPTEEEPGALLVVQACTATENFVAFVGGYRADDVLLAWRKRSLAGRMKWRVDRPWSEVRQPGE